MQPPAPKAPLADAARTPALRALLAGAALALASAGAHAAELDWKPYGKLFMTLDQYESGADSYFRVHSNSSRLGVKGSVGETDGLEMAFQLEYEVDPAGDDATFKQRNSFVAVQGDSWGRLLLGKHDTAFKKGQGKIDVFSDLAADIKVILEGEDRVDNNIVYQTPRIAGGMRVTVNAIQAERGDAGLADSLSLAFEYGRGGVWVGVASNRDVGGWDGNRVAAVLSFGPATFGILAQAMEETGPTVTGEGAARTYTISENSGLVLSLKYRLSPLWTLRAQYGSSSNDTTSTKDDTTTKASTDGELAAVGIDRKVGGSRVFAYFSDVTTRGGKEETAVGVGVEFNF